MSSLENFVLLVEIKSSNFPQASCCAVQEGPNRTLTWKKRQRRKRGLSALNEKRMSKTMLAYYGETVWDETSFTNNVPL